MLISSFAMADPSRISVAACMHRCACRGVSPVVFVTQASHWPWGTTFASFASISVFPIPMYPVPICSLYRWILASYSARLTIRFSSTFASISMFFSSCPFCGAQLLAFAEPAISAYSWHFMYLTYVTWRSSCLM